MSPALTQKAAERVITGPAFRPGLLVVPVALSLVLGGATAWNSMQQSLWIDELHTAWASSGSWQEVVPRAAAGNQTPVYFGWLWWLGRTFGQSEVSLRATSLIAWLTSLAVFAWVVSRLAVRFRRSGLWWLVCLAALDRQQIFFATEARPYMLMSLIVLLGWLSLYRCLENEPNRSLIHSRGPWLSWLACCVLALWLQPVAALFVAAQFAWAIWRGGARWPIQLSTLAILVILNCLVWPMRYVLEPAWQSRQAWTAFAADLHWQNVLKLLPILVVAVPGAVAGVIAWLNVWAGGVSCRSEPDDSCEADRRLKSYGCDGMFFVAWFLPLAMVILLAYWRIAPLVHARYLFAATLPLMLWAACMLTKLPSPRWVTLVALGMVLLQLVQQGSLNAWLVGRLPTAERGEQWREAVAYIEQASFDNADHVQIFCASNLIEGARSDFLSGGPLSEEYLSLPLRSLYRVTKQARIVSLLNDPTHWQTVISGSTEPSATRWLLVRASPAGLAKRLQISGLRPVEQIDFGAVQLVRF